MSQHFVDFASAVVSENGEDQKHCLLQPTNFSCRTLEYVIRNSHGNIMIQYRRGAKTRRHHYCSKYSGKLLKDMKGGRNIVIDGKHSEDAKSSISKVDCEFNFQFKQARTDAEVVKITWKYLNMTSTSLKATKGWFQFVFTDCFIAKSSVQQGYTHGIALTSLFIHILHCTWINGGEIGFSNAKFADLRIMNSSLSKLRILVNSTYVRVYFFNVFYESSNVNETAILISP